jgi:hypothetical protein
MQRSRRLASLFFGLRTYRFVITKVHVAGTYGNKGDRDHMIAVRLGKATGGIGSSKDFPKSFFDVEHSPYSIFQKQKRDNIVKLIYVKKVKGLERIIRAGPFLQLSDKIKRKDVFFGILSVYSAKLPEMPFQSNCRC